jgi:hypothetical protein
MHPRGIPVYRYLRALAAPLLLVLFAWPAMAHVNVFGPRPFPATASETFGLTGPCDLTPGAVYTLVAVNDGLSSGSVRVNGVEVLAERDFNQQVTTLERQVTLQASNVLAVTIRGGKQGAKLTLSIRRHFDDTAGPQLSMSVADGQVVAASPLVVTGTVSDVSGTASLTINGAAVAVSAAGTFSADVALVTGPNTIAFEATDCEGNVTRREVTVTLNAAPVLTITSPAPGTFSKRNVTVSGTVTSAAGIQSVLANGVAMNVAGSTWSGTVAFTADGVQELSVVATDVNGKQATQTVSVTVDETAPAIVNGFPPLDVVRVAMPEVELIGPATDAVSGIASVTCNGAIAPVRNDVYRCTVALQPGANTIAVRAVDRAGNEASLSREMEYVVDSVPPQITARVFGSAGANGWYRDATIEFTCTDNLGVICAPPAMVYREGAAQQISGEAVDGAGNRASASIAVSVDATSPLLTIDGESPRRSRGDVRISGTATDAVSGIASLRCGQVNAVRDGARFDCTLALEEGDHVVPVVVTDVAGNEAQRELLIVVDTTAPVVTILEPEDASVTNAATVEVFGTATDAHGLDSVTVNGQAAGAGEEFSAVVTLQDGLNEIEVRATDRAGNTGTATVQVRRYERALLDITSPDDFAVLSAATITVTGTVSGSVTAIDVNGVAASLSGGSFTATGVPLAQGRTVVTATAHTPGGQIVADHVNLYRDAIPPRVEVYSPEAGATVTASPVTISGMVDDIVIGTINAGQVQVTVNGIAASVANRGFVANGVALTPGQNTITIVGTDQAGNASTKTHTIHYAVNRPRLVAVSGNAQTAAIGTELESPLRVRVVDASGAPVPNAQVVFTVTQNDGTIASGDQSGREVFVTSNASGEASVQWTLGHRAGAGNNRVTATAAGHEGTAEFHATGTNGAPALIVVDSGPNQFGVSNEPLPRPLVAIVVDAGSNRLAGVPVTFSVVEGGGSFDGGESIVVLTDSDGRAVAIPRLGPGSGNDNNRFSAVAPGVQPGVLFAATGRPSGPPSQTRISGVVLDNSSVPVEGVTIRIDETARTVRTGAEGQFVIDAAPVGYVKLIVDGSTAERAGTWPMLEFVMYTNSGQENTIGMPIYLLPIDVTRGIQVTETTGGTLTFAELPGFSLEVAPGSALFPNGSRAGTVSATLVHADRMPMTPGFGQQPRFIVTIQPPGVHFDPPARMTLPNLDALAPGEITELYSFDHDLGQFVAIGTGTVSADGTVVESDPGVGIIKGGWHCGGNPNPTGTASCLTVTASLDIPEQSVGGATAVARRVGTDADPRRAARRIAALATADPKVTATGACVKLSASGSPAGAGYGYSWSIASGNGTITPSCANQADCTMRGNSQGVVVAKVTYRAPSGEQKSETVSARFVNLQISLKSMSFLDDVKMLKDEPNWVVTSGGTPPPIPPIVDPVWKNTNLSTENNAVTYVRNKKVIVEAVFTLNVPLPAPLPKTHFEAKLFGGLPALRTESAVEIPSGVTEFKVKVVGESEMPNTTAQHELLMTWNTLPPSACAFPVASGVANQKMYVLLAPPLGGGVFQTTAHLATVGGTADSVEEAIEFTWRQFGNGSAPTHVSGWKGQPFRYYPFGSKFEDCAGSIEAILSAIDGDTRCGGLGALALYAMAANGIQSKIVTVNPVDAHGFLVKNWTFGTSSVSNVTGWWLFKTTYGEPYWNEMVPPPTPPNRYGDLLNGGGAPGQHSPTPTEKAHVNHALLAVGGRLVDPSYGLEYFDVVDVQAKAIDGFFRLIAQFAAPPDNHKTKLAWPAEPDNTQIQLTNWP